MEREVNDTALQARFYRNTRLVHTLKETQTEPIGIITYKNKKPLWGYMQ